jgi:hypothetical protein
MDVTYLEQNISLVMFVENLTEILKRDFFFHLHDENGVGEYTQT